MAFAKKHGVSRETVRLWILDNRVEVHYVTHVSGEKEMIIPEDATVEIIPKGWITIHEWCKKHDINLTTAKNALYTKKLPFVKRYFKKDIVPEGAAYPKLKKGPKKGKMIPGYLKIKTWCRINQFPYMKMLRKNYLTPNSKWIYEQDFYWVPKDWDGLSGFNSKEGR